MKKTCTIFMLAICATLSLYAGKDKAKAAPSSHKKIKLAQSSKQAQETPWVSVTVNDAPGLTTAINDAAINVEASTLIYIDGVIQGNFVIPATVNQIKLIGTGTTPTLSANGSGTVLTVLLGANVTIEKLTITGAGGAAAFGINNAGSLQILRSIITGNNSSDDDGGGIYNSGALYIHKSAIDSNTNYGIESQEGGIMKIDDSSISNNTSTGIYLWTGEICIDGSRVTGNGDSGIYNYYGAAVSINNCQVNENTNYGIYNIYNAGTSITGTLIDSNTEGGIYSEGGGCLLQDSTITNHSESGVYNYNYSLLNVRNCKFINNAASAIYNTEVATLVACDSTFQANSNEGNGGAIFNASDCVTTVSNCTFSENMATAGGAIYNNNLFTLINSKVEANTSTENGAGIYNNSEASFVSRGSHINGNTSLTGDGGGVYNQGTATFVDSRIKHNSASQGGGVANITPGSMLLATSKIKHNIATYGAGGGGGVFSTGSLEVEACDVSQNIPDDFAP